MDLKPVFAYGSLMCPLVYKNAVKSLGITQDRRQVQGILCGYKRVCVKNAPYPAMIKTTENDQIIGKLIFVESLLEIDALDKFESEIYSRINVQIQVQESWGVRNIDAYAYEWNSSIDSLDFKDWDFDDFIANKLPTWILEEFPV